MADLNLPAMAKALEASGLYRVLRKLGARAALPVPDGEKVRTGLFVDVETTGLDPRGDEIIELAMIPFTYGHDGTVYAVLEPFHGYRQPAKPIPEEITALTGIDDAMVEGQAIDAEASPPSPRPRPWSSPTTPPLIAASSNGPILSFAPSPGPVR